MNAKQLAVAQSVTSKQWIDWNVGSSYGDFTFAKLTDDKYGFTILGTNGDTKHWLDKLVFVTITIGKRGGIKKRISKH